MAPNRRDDSGKAPPLRNTQPTAIVSIGFDAVVGETIADFVDVKKVTPPEPHPVVPASGRHLKLLPRSTEPAPESAQPVERHTPKAGLRSFADELSQHLEPDRKRLLDEAARLEWVRRAALDYIDRRMPDPDQ